MSLYERFASTARGAHALAAARLRHEFLGALHQALKLSGLTQSDIAQSLGIRRSAVNQVFRGDGNLRINTVADYLHAMGFELDVRLVHAGEPRKAAVEQRAIKPAVPDWRVQAPQPAPTDVFSPEGVDDTPVRVRWLGPVDMPVAAYSPQTTNPAVSMRLGAVS
ncbi:helix-turn-helix domain-containing protein [Streptosporangium roseum]|uniref:helix-turn-helix domain-containing protein n=1 Tax=Streptosporangium roseum TaxID=2001 RepID=UPI0018CC1735